MNERKKTELLQRRNESLARQLENAKLSLKKEKNINEESQKRIDSLICDLEQIKTNFEMSLNEINKEKELYKELIDEMVSFRSDLTKGILPKRNILKKIKDKFKRY